ncbi:polysaccharide deacetylase family protein [Actinoplanes sp. NPDC051851]|uniref:carbohydrate deacetylase n=1 Tax=Actinoplanes sp. NPDC051851 TaxID=3154753 RepID=UPI00341E99CB
MRASELLGYPPEARVLLINCDDFGMSTGINAAVVAAIEDGVAASCSLMVPCPGAADAMRRLRQRPHLPFGVHLTLVCEMPETRWGPVAGRARVPSLLEESGELFAPSAEGRAALLGQARIEEVEVEFRAQIDAVARAGLEPAHLDFHCLADGGRADVLELTIALAGEYGLAARVWLDDGRRAMRARGLPVVDHDFLDSYALDLDGKFERYLRLLRELPAGLTEWAVHPGPGDDHARAVDPGWRVRRTDYEFLVSPAAQEVLTAEGIVVIGYPELRRIWRQVRSGSG